MPQSKEERRKYNQNRVSRLKAAGLCSHCGQRPASVGSKRCGKCLEDARRRDRLRRKPVAEPVAAPEPQGRPEPGFIYPPEFWRDDSELD